MSRELALKLACLHETDRQWIVSQLSHQERNVIEPLMDEVIELGLHRDPSVLSSIASVIDDAPLNSEELNGITDMTGLDEFWQSILLGSIENKQRAGALKKLRMTISGDSAIEKPPAKLKLALIASLRENA